MGMPEFGQIGRCPLKEFDYRCEAYKDTASEDYAEQYGQDAVKVIGAFLEGCDARLAELRSAA